MQRVDQDENELIAAFDGRDVSYGFGELDELVLAYATTIHKSQGSEYPAVVIPQVTQQYMTLARSLLYIGVTRNKRLSCWWTNGRRWPLQSAIKAHAGAGPNCVSTLLPSGVAIQSVQGKRFEFLIRWLGSADAADVTAAPGEGATAMGGFNRRFIRRDYRLPAQPFQSTPGILMLSRFNWS